jgi:biotin carboxylase
VSQKTIVIVDAISGGRYFPKIAAEYFGLECVHILSSGTLPGVIVSSYNAKDFVRSFVWSDRDRDSILEYLRELNLVGVIAGSEVGVELADLLSETLNLPGNGTGNSRARRSKILMHKLVSESKVRVPKQISTDNLTDMLSFVDEHLTFPLVVKPDESAGSDGFYLANNWTEASQAFYNIYRKTNQLGQKNTSVLIQEFIQGDEFAVNTVSAHGVHVITHIWKYHKKTIGPNRVYDWEEYIDLDSQIGLEISHFAKKVIT